MYILGFPPPFSLVDVVWRWYSPAGQLSYSPEIATMNVFLTLISFFKTHVQFLPNLLYPIQQVTSDMQATSYPTQPGVPGQTVYVHQPAPVNYATPVQNPNSSSGVSQKFNGAAGRATGWIQVFLGIGSIVVAIAELVLHTSVGYVAMGIWASVLVSLHLPFLLLGMQLFSYMINTIAMSWEVKPSTFWNVRT